MLSTDKPGINARPFALQKEDLDKLSIMYCRAKPYILFIYREFSYYNKMIAHVVHSGFADQSAADMHFASSVFFWDETTFLT